MIPDPLFDNVEGHARAAVVTALSPIVLYIAGYGRSGSTVLDMALASAGAGLGEFVRILEGWKRNALCSCRRPYRTCAFWARVMERCPELTGDADALRAAQVTRRIEGRFGVHARIPAAAAAEYERIWRALFVSVASVSGSRVLIDSSKSDRRTGGRAVALATLAGLDVRVIHLVRDPRAVAWSVMRGSNRLLEAGEPAAVAGGAARALVGWSAANLAAHRAAGQLPSIRIRYEDFVRDPAAEIGRVQEGLDVPLGRAVESLRRGEPLGAGHGVAGNRMRRRGVDSVRKDAEWIERLPARVRLLAAATWPLARYHGYDVTGISAEAS